MVLEPLHELELVTVARLLRDRDLSAVDLTAHMLARIERLDSRLHGFAWCDATQAIRQAEAADLLLARGAGGPLTGVPLAVKDLFWTKDMPTAAGMSLHRDFQPNEDATVVHRLRQAGAVIPGKLQMTEGAFALHHPDVAPPLNPWNAALWPGASSSGSGVALAAGLCFGALGSDTGGSIRFPCAAHGLTGLKPSWGRVSRHGTFELAASLDHVGPMARSARDAALLYAVIAGHDPRDPTSWPDPAPAHDPEPESDLAGLVVGFDPAALAACDPDLVTALAEVLDTLRGLGCEIREVTLPDVIPAVEQWELLAGIEAAVAHEETYPSRAAEYGPALRRLIDLGRAASAIDFQRARLARMALRGSLDTLLAEVDVLVSPVLPYAAPTLDRLGELAADPAANAHLIAFTAPFNLGGQPALSLPCRPTPDNGPVGFQIVAARGREDLLLRAGTAFQQVTQWHLRHPAD